MGHPFKHFRTITKHRNRVIYNAFHMGIGFHALGHDLSKYGYTEFHNSSINYTGTCSPVFLDRLKHNYYSIVCQHHTKRNPHHWEYWTDFFMGRIITKNMPYKYATEYVCDVLSAAYVYNPKGFKPDSALNYFNGKVGHYYMTKATIEYITWCFEVYSKVGFKGLKKKITKAKYDEITKKYPAVEIYENTLIDCPLPDINELRKKYNVQ